MFAVDLLCYIIIISIQSIFSHFAFIKSLHTFINYKFYAQCIHLLLYLYMYVIINLKLN